jgi:2-keto-4-pentenoate hydratase/2-oxohepta-3-ene-1,7-dioic acid hydratase in catechol pathway
VKLVTFSVGARTSYGILADGGIVDAGARFGSVLPDVRAVLDADALGRLERLGGSGADFRVDDVTLRQPVLRPGKIVCVGVNYAGRNAEYKDGSDQQKYPSLFRSSTTKARSPS